MTNEELVPWSTRAVNLPEHGDNPVHTDEGAAAAGYRAAIVAGTSVYAYMTHPPAAAWGLDWVGGGGGELHLRAPVFDNDEVVCGIEPGPTGSVVEARVDDEVKATFALVRESVRLPVRSGEDLETFEVVLDERWAGYGTRSGDTLGLYGEQAIVHPAAWPALANQVFSRYLIDGPWIHTRSLIGHRGLAATGTTAVVSSTVVQRFETRAGERALVDVRIFAGNELVAEVEHEALVRLA